MHNMDHLATTGYHRVRSGSFQGEGNDQEPGKTQDRLGLLPQ